MIKKLINIFVIVFIALFISSCESVNENVNFNVKLYCIKDEVYFTNPLGYVEIEKEKNSTINEEDLVTLYKDTHGLTDEEVIIKSYKLYKDVSLKEELDNDYEINGDDTIYVLLNATRFSGKIGDGYPLGDIFYTGSKKGDEIPSNFYYPLNSLYINGYYIQLESNTVSFDLLYEVYFNYRRFYGLTFREKEFNVDLSCKEKFSFEVGDDKMLNVGESYTLSDDYSFISVYYDGYYIQSYMFGGPQ